MKNVSSYILMLFILFFSCKQEMKIDKETTLPFFNSAEFTPEWIPENTTEYNNIHKISTFKLVNQNNKIITNKTYDDKIYITDFFFVSCPGICPVLTKNMKKIADVFKKDNDVLLLSHTVMPTKDSVSVLKKHALENNIKADKWNLVTGDKSQIYSLARNAYFADEDFIKTQNEDAFIHTENLLLIDKKRRIRGVYNGTLALDIKRLIRHISILKKENKKGV